MKRIDPTKITPATLWTDAKHFRIATEVLVDVAATAAAAGGRDNETRVRQLLHPTWQLICTSIELGFKAYLNHRGFAVERLKDEFRHDLAKLQQAALTEARDSALLAQIVNAVEQAVDLLNDPYMDKRFIYRKIGWERYPKEQARVCGWIKAYLAEIKLLMDLPVQGDGPEAEGIQPLSPPTGTVTRAASAVA